MDNINNKGTFNQNINPVTIDNQVLRQIGHDINLVKKQGLNLNR